MLRYVLGLLLSTSQLALGSSFQDKQVILVPSPEVQNAHTRHFVDKEILTALKTHSDPVAVLVALQPEIAATLAEPRLLHIFGDQKPEWMTEGDKLRLHRRGKKFMDITDHQDFYAQQVDTLSGKASESLLNPVELISFILL
jgi:leucyl aminopeptidase